VPFHSDRLNCRPSWEEVGGIPRYLLLPYVRYTTRVDSYKNAQYFGETGQYPLRCDITRALFGYASDPSTTVPFYSEKVVLDLRIVVVPVDLSPDVPHSCRLAEAMFIY
jgi:hypothetical protein